MSSTNWYTDLPSLKQECGIPPTNTDHDESLELAIESACREIDNHVGDGRHFYSATETRYYTACEATKLEIDDVLSITALNVDTSGEADYNTTFTSADYWLGPANASNKGWPYTEIVIPPFSSASLPTTPRAIKVTGVFGFNPSSAVPPPVKKAALFHAAALFRAAQQPTGFEGGRDFGAQFTLGAGLHPFVRRSLDTYRRRTMA